MILAGVLALILGVATPVPSPSPSPSPSPATRPLYVAPKHWIPVAVGAAEKQQGFLANYVSLRGNGGDFNIVQGRNVGLPIAQFAKVNVAAAAHDMHATIFESEAVTLCDGHPGWLVRYHKPQGSGQFTVMQIFGVTDTHAYIATYARPSTVQDDADAVAAVRSLCPPPEKSAGADTSAVPIEPPQGWQRLNPSAISDSPDFIGLWIGDTTGGFPQSLNLVRSPAMGTMPLADEAPLIVDVLKRKYPDLTMRQSHAERLCNKLDGWYFEYRAQMKGHDIIMEQTVVVDGATMYAASYGRANGAAESAAARASLDSLCPQDAAVAS